LTEYSKEPDTLTATAELRIGSQKLRLKLVVPAGEVPPEVLLPSLQQLSDRVVEGVGDKARRNGLEISCRKGCGACCRQLVPISPAEARLLAVIVENMPTEAQALIRERFDQAVQRLQASGLQEQAINYHRLPKSEIRSMGRAYFELGIPCPFLNDEACSIHPIRPLVCREYLVISSPDHCATLAGEHIRRLQFPVSIASAFAGMDGVSVPGENIYLPLIMALQWSAAHAGEVELRPGPEWVQAFFQDLSGARIPDPVIPGRVLYLPDDEPQAGPQNTKEHRPS
jgi:Fe-S-cluster containining protein